MKVSEVLSMLETRAPSGTAEEWDNVGLILGDPATRTEAAIVSVDLTDDAVDAALGSGARLIVTHHACIFPKSHGLAKVTAGTPVYRALRKGIAVVACHTNFDRCALEVVEALSEALGAKPKGRLHDLKRSELLKLAVFVPQTHVEAVREALAAAGAGHVGDYDSCTFGAAGEGTFRGGKGTNPFLGKPGKLERAREVRLETILPQGLRKPVLQALHSAHPYEEVAYDLYPLAQEPASRGVVKGLGYGFYGDLPKPLAFPAFARRVKEAFGIEGFWISQPSPKTVRRIGFIPGDGGSFIPSAVRSGCDLMITGEAGYHRQLGGSRQGMPVMELGHRESERFFLSTMSGWLKASGLKTRILDVPTQKIWGG